MTPARGPTGRRHVTVTRAYDPPARDGVPRVLVDRLWPRGVTKAAAEVDEWAKEVAPSTELRRWYGHDPARFEEFAQRYRAELAASPAKDALAHLRSLARSGPIVLVTATKDLAHSGAVVLEGVLARHR
jgi:uncharacterized protein YeaO (DUF488 family)